MTVPKIYVIEPGDSLYELAGRSGVDVEIIKKINIGKGERSGVVAAYEKRSPSWYLDVGEILFFPSQSELGTSVNDEEGRKLLVEALNNGRISGWVKETKNKKAKSGGNGSVTHSDGEIDCPVCKVKGLSLTCSHGSRDYIEICSPEDNSIFSVVAGRKGDKISAKVVSQKCPNGDVDCPSIKISGPVQEHISESSTEITVYGPEIGIVDDGFREFLQSVCFPTQRYREYAFSTSTCQGDGKTGAKIRAYTPISWDGEISVGYFHPEDGRTWKRQVKQGYWGTEGQISLSVDEQQYKIGSPKIKGKVKNSKITDVAYAKVMESLGTLVDLCDRLPKGLGGGNVKKAEVFWPKVTLKGGVRSVEVYNSAEVGVAGKITLGFLPLFGGVIEIDILGILRDMLGKGHALIAALNALLDLVNDCDDIEVLIEVIFKLENRIEGTLTWDFGDETKPTTSESSLIPEGQINTPLEFTLEGNAKVTIDTFIFTASAGAKMGGKMGFGFQAKATWKNGKPYVHLCSQFLGATVYYLAYMRVGGPDEKTEITGKRPKDSESQKTSSGMGKTIVVWEPKSFPKEPKDIALSEMT